MPKDEAKVEGFVVLSRLMQARAPIQVLLLVSTRVPTPKTLNPKHKGSFARALSQSYFAFGVRSPRQIA